MEYGYNAMICPIAGGLSMDPLVSSLRSGDSKISRRVWHKVIISLNELPYDRKTRRFNVRSDGGCRDRPRRTGRQAFRGNLRPVESMNIPGTDVRIRAVRPAGFDGGCASPGKRWADGRCRDGYMYSPMFRTRIPHGQAAAFAEACAREGYDARSVISGGPSIWP